MTEAREPTPAGSLEDDPPGASVLVSQRYGKRLRRMAAAGRIRQIQEGRAHHEALYTREDG